MPLKTTVLSTTPVLVQQHVLTVHLQNNDTPQSRNKSRVLSATIITYGATLTHLHFPDRWNQPQDLVLGFDRWQDYLDQAQAGALNPYFGAVIGRTASRIAHASFELSDSSLAATAPEIHQLQVSNGLDCHHGGPLGFDKQHWTTVRVTDEKESETSPAVQLQLISPHGQNGYPGRVITLVEYRLTPQGELVIEYEARLSSRKQEDEKEGAGNDEDLKDTKADKQDLHSTIVSLTHHAYWNLDGVLNPSDATSLPSTNDPTEGTAAIPILQNECTIRDHTLWLNTSQLIELGSNHPVPTGRILDVSSSTSTLQNHDLLSFSSSVDRLPSSSSAAPQKKLGPGLDAIPGGYGYDHVYALPPPPSSSLSSPLGIQAYYPATPHAATLYSPRTGIRLDLSTSEPALVLYAGGYLDHTLLPKGATKSRTINLPDASTSSLFSPSATPLQDQEQTGGKWTIEAKMGPFSALSLEPIRYPDAIHHPEWASMVTLHAGQVYRQRTLHKFSLQT